MYPWSFSCRSTDAYGARRRGPRTAGGEHGVEDEHVPPIDRGELPVIRLRLQRRLVALEPDVADGDLGEQLRDGLEHPKTRSEDRHGDEVAEHLPRGGLQRRANVDVGRREVADRLDREHERESLGERSEQWGGGGPRP